MGWSDPAPRGLPASEPALRAAVGALADVGIDPDRAAAFARWLGTAPDEEVLAVRPAALGDVGGDALDLLLAAHETGMARLVLRLVCRWCGGISASLRAVCDAGTTFRCEACDLEQPAELDVSVEAVFTPDPSFRDVPARDAAALSAGPRFRLHHFHPDAATPDGEPYANAVPERLAGLADLEPGDRIELDFSGEPGDLVEIVALPGSAAHASLLVRDGEPPGLVRFDGRAFDPGFVRCGAGPLVVEHAGSAPAALCALWIVRNGRRMQPAGRVPASTARDVYLHPRARSRLRHLLLPDAALSVRDVAVWFSDIQGSTALYEASGDLEAWRRVQEHFAAVRDIVVGHGGSVIKTLGDAVMAAFASPEAAARSAAEAVRCRAGGFNLRVGLHRGPVLAVASDGVPDIFGHTVNVAARLQSLAEPGEICTTSAVVEHVGDVFSGWSARQETVALKGVVDPVPVVRVTP
jgi:class 3 adenylate cyclase